MLSSLLIRICLCFSGSSHWPYRHQALRSLLEELHRAGIRHRELRPDLGRDQDLSLVRLLLLRCLPIQPRESSGILRRVAEWLTPRMRKHRCIICERDLEGSKLNYVLSPMTSHWVWFCKDEVECLQTANVELEN